MSGSVPSSDTEVSTSVKLPCPVLADQSALVTASASWICVDASTKALPFEEAYVPATGAAGKVMVPNRHEARGNWILARATAAASAVEDDFDEGEARYALVDETDR